MKILNFINKNKVITIYIKKNKQSLINEYVI